MSSVNDIYRKHFGVDADPGSLAYWQGTGLQGEALEQNILAAAAENERKRLERYHSELGGANDVLANNDYTAFFRKMQFDENEIRSASLAQKEALQRKLDIARGRYDFQRHQAASSIEKDFASRGLRRAGGRIRTTNEATARINQTQNEAELANREQQASLEKEAASRIAALRRERAEREREAREQMTRDSVRR